MYYVETNTDVLDNLQMIKEQQKTLMNNVRRNQKRFDRKNNLS